MKVSRIAHELLLTGAATIAFWLLLAFILAACGGGGGGSPSAPPAPTRGPLVVGYYGSCPACVEQTYRHVTVTWAFGWFEDRATTIAAAKQRGLKVVLYLPEAYVSEQAVRDLFTTLRAQGLLEQVAYLYPEDEPDLKHDEAAITAAHLVARRVSAEFGISPKIAVIYAGLNDFPGIASADVIGADDYSLGPNILPLYNLIPIRPGQTLMLVPGGADPWRQDPAPFFAYARAHANVEMVTSFLWGPDFADRGVGLGIGSNGMAQAYCREAIAFTGGTC